MRRFEPPKQSPHVSSGMVLPDSIYPEVTQHGTLPRWLHHIAQQLYPNLEVPGFEEIQHPIRTFRITAALNRRLLMAYGWENGVQLTRCLSTEMVDPAQFWMEWMVLNSPLLLLKEHCKPVEFEVGALHYDQGPEAYSRWKWAFYASDRQDPGYVQFMQAGLEKSLYQKLCPHFKHGSLLFSQNTGYPYETQDLAIHFLRFEPQQRAIYLVIVGLERWEADAQEAATFLQGRVSQHPGVYHGRGARWYLQKGL